jgi:hypothetical protein
MGDTSTPYTITSLKMDNKKELHTWLGSVIEFLDTKGQTIHQSGAQPSLVDTPITLINPNTKVAKWFGERDISTYGDIRQLIHSGTNEDTGYNTFQEGDVNIAYTSTPPTQEIRPITDPIEREIKEAFTFQVENPTVTPPSQIIIPQEEQGHITTRRGQLWFTPDINSAYEILGRASNDFDTIHWRKWSIYKGTEEDQISPNTLMIPLNEDLDRGAGSDIQSTVYQLFTAPPRRLHYKSTTISDNINQHTIPCVRISHDTMDSLLPPHNL